MNSTTATFIRIGATILATALVGLPAIWGAFALWYQVPAGNVAKAVSIALWSAFSITMILALWQDRMAVGLLLFVLAFGGLLIWWTRIPPSNEGRWADDVAQMTHGAVAGNTVTLHNVRNFDWRSATDYTQRWETRTYDLDQLRSVDMIMSYWGMRAIAHMLISFGFENGSQVVFSVEIRRQTFQAFSEVGGFFKEFELSIIAADERDVIRLRTNIRGEDDYLYQLHMSRAAMRALFLGYVSEANRLVESPRFYNTISVNCTTLVYHMMKRIVGRLPLDYRLLLSGYLPEYVYSVKGLNPSFKLNELRERGRITDRAKRSDRSPDFSADIRVGLPEHAFPHNDISANALPGTAMADDSLPDNTLSDKTALH